MDAGKSLRALLAFLLICLMVPSSALTREANGTFQSIDVVSDDNYPPYVYRDSEGNIKGILVDEWRLWEKKTGIKVNFIAMDWVSAQAFFHAGRADVIDTIFYTEERAKQYDFTKPYLKIDVPIFFHKNLSGIVDIASLQGFTIGVKAGDACIEVLKKHGITSLKEFSSYEAIVKAAADHQIKVFSIDKPPALYYLYKMNLEDEFRYSLNLYTGEFHRAVHKGRTDLLKIVEDGFAQITIKEHDAIEKKWRGVPFFRAAYLYDYLYVLLGLAALFLVLLFFNFALRKKVREKTSELQHIITQLRTSEEKYRELVENANSIVLRRDVQGNVTFFNEFAQKFFGYGEEEILGKNIVGTIVPETDSSGRDLTEMIKDIAEHPDQYINNVNENMRRNGERVWIAWTNKPVYGENGELIGLLCIGNDISERKRAEKILQESERQYRALIETTNTGYVIIDAEGMVLDANAEYVRLTGHRALHDIVGRNVLEWTSGAERQKNAAAVLACSRDGFVRNLEINYYDAVGNVTPIEINATVVEKDGAKQILTLCRDITSRKRAELEKQGLEERLHRAEKMEVIGTLAGGVAHDLNNVLGVLV
ncbi:MAG: PAS domain S-box protein, partial [Syntrophales bacterium]|nr:PAS domain S-box protein [Syntrophales bacterium]